MVDSKGRELGGWGMEVGGSLYTTCLLGLWIYYLVFKNRKTKQKLKTGCSAPQRTQEKEETSSVQPKHTWQVLNSERVISCWLTMWHELTAGLGARTLGSLVLNKVSLQVLAELLSSKRKKNMLKLLTLDQLWILSAPGLLDLCPVSHHNSLTARQNGGIVAEDMLVHNCECSHSPAPGSHLYPTPGRRPGQ